MNLRTLGCLSVVILLAMSSCQKSYERPDITLPGTSGGTGGGGSTSGKYMIRSEAKTTGNTTEGIVNKYEYDGNNRITNITKLYTDSFNKVTINGYFYKRDAAGRVVRVSQNLVTGAPAGTPGIPDSVFMTVHYPSATSTNFDYTVSKMDFLGISTQDSTVYTYSNGLIVKKAVYSGTSLSVMALSSTVEYEYANGNLVMVKQFVPTAPMAIAVFALTYDDKVTCMQNGIEAFLPGRGEGTLSKNNGIKELYTDNSNGLPMANVTYTYQYNSDNMPVTGTLSQTVPIVKTQALKFFYK